MQHVKQHGTSWRRIQNTWNIYAYNFTLKIQSRTRNVKWHVCPPPFRTLDSHSLDWLKFQENQFLKKTNFKETIMVYRPTDRLTETKYPLFFKGSIKIQSCIYIRIRWRFFSFKMMWLGFLLFRIQSRSNSPDMLWHPCFYNPKQKPTQLATPVLVFFHKKKYLI